MPPPPPTPIQEVAPVRYDANLYSFFGLKEGDRKSYIEAKEDCRNKNAALVTIQDGDEHQESLRTLVEDYFETNPDWNFLKFWVGYKTDGDGGLVAVDRKDSSYVAARMKNDLSNSCVFGDKMRSIMDQPLTLDFDTFAAGGCDSLRPYMCEVSDCSICDTCVESVYDQFTSKVAALGSEDLTISNILNGVDGFRGWKALCEDVFEADTCEDVSVLIAASATNNFNFAKRPAAICAAIGRCEAEDECNIVSQDDSNDVNDTPQPMDFCTVDGTVGADVLGTKNFTQDLVGNECISDGDCGTGEFCKTSDSTDSAFACDSNTGIDESQPKGTCVSLCEQPAIEDAEQQVLDLFPGSVICNTSNPEQQGCGEGFECLDALPACRTNFQCDATSGEAIVEFDDCPGMCFREAKELVSAVFSEDGGSLRANLTTKAQAFSAPCSQVFDTPTSNILGLANCRVFPEARETLVIELGGDATVDTTSTLQLRSSADETPLRDFLQGNNYSTPDGGAPVGPPEGDLVAPTAVLTGPATFRQPCGDEGFATIYLDSSESSGASGRPLSRSWSFSNDNDCVSHDINDQTDLLSGLLRTANEGDGLTTLRMEDETLQGMEEGVHCITLSVTNFLGASSEPTVIRIEKLVDGIPPPTVQILAPSSTTIGAGVTLSATVDTSSVCPGEKAEYQWKCTSAGCPLLGGPDVADQFVSKVTNVLTPSDLVGRVTPGAVLQFELSARMKRGNDFSDVESVSKSIQFNGDSIVAGFTRESPSGDIPRDADEALVFHATGSDPSDPSNSAQPMRFSFKCERPDGISPCFKETADGGFYTGSVIDGRKWELDIGQFVDDANNIFIISVTISKGTGENLRQDTARRFIRLRATDVGFVSARIDQDCGEGCTGTSSSTESLSFAAIILNTDDLGEEPPTYSWTMNGNPVRQRHLLVPADGEDPNALVNAPSITVNPFEVDSETSIIPRSGQLSIECTINVGDASGVATTSIALVGPPVCSRDSCLELEPPTSQLPEITFRAEAAGFSSPNSLLFEFGFMVDNELEVQQSAGLERAVTLRTQNGVNEYMVYVAAIDSVTGGRSAPETALFNLTEYTPEGDSCEAQQANFDEALEGKANQTADFDLLQATGDNKAIFGGVKAANGLSNANANPPPFDLCNSGGRRSLLEEDEFFERKTLEGLNALLGTLVDEDGEVVGTVADALGALTSIQSTFESSDPTLDQAQVLAKVVDQALDILADSGASDIGTTTIRAALRNAGQAAEKLKECEGASNACADDQGTFRRAMRLMDTLREAGTLMRRNAPSGKTTVAVSSRAGQAVSRNTLAATSTANVAFDVAVMGRDDRMRAGAVIITPTDFVEWCNGNSVCSGRDRLTLYLNSIRDAAIYTDATTGFPTGIPSLNHFSGAEKAPEAVSGVFEAQFDFKDEDARLCSSTKECKMSLTIPLSSNLPNDRTAACVRLVPEEEEDGTGAFSPELAIPEAEVSEDGFQAICKVSRLGRYVVVSYTLPPSPPPPPADETPPPPPDSLSPSPSPSPPPDQVIDPPTGTPSPPPPGPPALTPVDDQECTGAANKELSATLRFNKPVNRTMLAGRLQRNYGTFLGLVNGLECEVEVTVVDQEDGGTAPSDQHTRYRATADLGSKTPGSAVVRARREVKTVADREQFKPTFLDKDVNGETDPLTALDGTPVTVEVEEVSDPTSLDGCSAEPGKIIEATIQLTPEDPENTDPLGEELAKLDPEDRNAKESELEERLQRVLDSLQNVVFDCPATFKFTVDVVSIENRRSLLSGNIQDLLVKGRALAGLSRHLLETDAGKLTIDMGNDASSDEISAARTAVRNANFGDAIDDFEINGKQFSVSAVVAGDVSDDDDDNDAEVLGPAIAIPVFFFLVAMGGLAYFVVRYNRKGARFSVEENQNQQV